MTYSKGKKFDFVSFFKNHWIIITILTLAIILRLIHLQQNYAIWWDSSIYLGVAKYIYSAGVNGMWEPYRPLVHPLLLGFFWKIGANLILVAKAFDLIFSLTTISLTYMIAKQLYSKLTAYYAVLILAIEPLFIMFTGLYLTEPLALTLGLLAIYLFLNRNTILPSWQKKSKFLLIGSLFAITALTKFPLGIIFFAALIARQLATKFQEKKLFSIRERIHYIQESVWFCIGFSIPFIPYLIFNYIKYNDPLYPFTSGSWIIGTFLWQYDTSFWFYFTDFFAVHQLFSLLAIAIIVFFINKDYKKEGRLTVYLSALLLFLYFWLQVPRKELRYLIIIYPFFTILVGSVIASLQIYSTQILQRISIQNYWQKLVSVSITIIFVAAIFGAQSAPAFFVDATYSNYQDSLEKLGDYIEDNNFTEMILVSSPYIAEHVDNFLFPTAGIDLAEAVYDHETGKFSYLLLRDCDYVCPEGDLECEKSKSSFFQRVDQENILLYLDEYETKTQSCNLFFYATEDNFQ
ncbi:hypothetical protein CL619_04640 [archaeon]|nr:hypothetical protein [archaeon]|tara:strand:+ start:1025 stop:2578 length:1554 start_codon:yes stop_codon:yes gene_type:complete